MRVKKKDETTVVGGRRFSEILLLFSFTEDAAQ
jgi:hypothetical protein